MDADTLKQMFDPFFTTKPVGQGTGMRMAIVYNEGMATKCVVAIKRRYKYLNSILLVRRVARLNHQVRQRYNQIRFRRIRSLL